MNVVDNTKATKVLTFIGDSFFRNVDSVKATMLPESRMLKGRSRVVPGRTAGHPVLLSALGAAEHECSDCTARWIGDRRGVHGD